MTELNNDPTGDIRKEEPQLFEEKPERKGIGIGKIILGIVIIVTGYLFWPRAAIEGEGVLQAEKFTRLGLTSSGVLKELFHKKGETLKKGDLIAKFENPELLKRYGQSEIELSKLEDEKVLINEKMKHLDRIKERTRMLYENGAAGKNSLENAEFDFRRATQEFVIVEKKIQSAKRELEFLKAEIESLELKAPFDGVLLSDPSETVGSPVQKGEFVLEIAAPETYFIEILIPEAEVEKISVGSKVRARFHSLSSRTYAGRVVRLAPRTTQEVEKVFKVRHVVPCEIKLDQLPENLRYGMHARIKINSKPKGVF